MMQINNLPRWRQGGRGAIDKPGDPMRLGTPAGLINRAPAALAPLWLPGYLGKSHHRENKRVCEPGEHERQRDRRCAGERRGLAALLVIGLMLVVCTLTAPTVRAAARQELPSHRMQQSSTGTDSQPTPTPVPSGPCADTRHLPLDCLSQPDTLNPANKVQNPIGDGSTLFFFTDPSVTYQQPLVLKLWGIMLGAVDVSAVVLLMLYGLQIIVAGTVFRYAQALETIPGLLLGLIAAHVSLIFIIFFLSLNNALSVDFYNWANANAPISLKSGVTVTEQVNVLERSSIIKLPKPGSIPNQCFIASGQVWCATTRTVTVDGLQITPVDLDFTNMLGNIQSLFDILSLIVKVLDLMLLAQVIIRVFFIDLYIIFAPVGLAYRRLTRLWVRGFLATVMTQFAQVVALVVVEIIVPTLFSKFHSQLTNQVIQASALVALCKIGALWFIFRIPALLEEAPTRTMMEAGQAMSTAVATTIGVQIGILQTAVSTGIGVMGIAGGAWGRSHADNDQGGNQAGGEQTGREPTGGRQGRSRTQSATTPAATNKQAKSRPVSVRAQESSSSGTDGQQTRPMMGSAPVGQTASQSNASGQPASGQAGQASSSSVTADGGATNGQEADPLTMATGQEVDPLTTMAEQPGGQKNVDWIDYKDL
jgi:hypothetical protein